MESTRMQRLAFWGASFQFMCGILACINFLYFAVKHNRKMDALGNNGRCVAKDGINHPIHVTGDTDLNYVTDVGDQFYRVFVAGLFINTLLTVMAIMVCFAPRTKLNAVYKGTMFAKTLDVIFVFAVSYIRWSHAGRVCSGDYIYKPITLESHNEGTLVLEAQFIDVFLIVQYIQLFILMVVSAVLTIFFDEVNEDKERDL